MLPESQTSELLEIRIKAFMKNHKTNNSYRSCPNGLSTETREYNRKLNCFSFGNKTKYPVSKKKKKRQPFIKPRRFLHRQCSGRSRNVRK